MRKITSSELDNLRTLPDIELNGNGGGCADYAVQIAAYFTPRLDMDLVESIMDIHEGKLPYLSPWQKIDSFNFFENVGEAVFLRIYRDSPILNRFIHTGILCDKSNFVGTNGSERFADNITQITEEYFTESGEFIYNMTRDEKVPFYLFYCPVSYVETGTHLSDYESDDDSCCCTCEVI